MKQNCNKYCGWCKKKEKKEEGKEEDEEEKEENEEEKEEEEETCKDIAMSCPEVKKEYCSETSRLV